jgi:hypothetical protein
VIVERINYDSNSPFPAICCKCEMIREKYSLQENNESLNNQDIIPTIEKSVNKDNSSRKLKHYTSIDRHKLI